MTAPGAFEGDFTSMCGPLPCTRISGALTDPAEPLPEWIARLKASTPGFDFEDRYRVLEPLGRGGHADVELVRDERIGRDLAAKLLRPSDRADDAFHLRFILEACRQARLEHPSIVPVHEVGVTRNGQPYFTMKRVRGLTLAEIIRKLRSGDATTRAKFSRTKLLSVLNSVALTIAFAHERGVLHRDIKPGNIMLGDFGETYVLDWGLGKLSGSPAEDSTDTPETGTPAPSTVGIAGTPGYMAPEQIRGHSEAIGQAADIYALGATLFEILTLEPLHDLSRPREQILVDTLRGADARPSVRAPASQVPPELEAICVRATAVDPTLRFQSAREMSEALERFLDGDRDLAVRRTMASTQAQVAEAELAAARTESPAHEASHRSRAMQAVGKALALDPTNVPALESLRQILSEPPRKMPAQAEKILEQNAALARADALKRGAVLYAAFLFSIPVLLWSGIRDWSFVVASVGLISFLAIFARATSKWIHQPSWVSYAHLIVANVSIQLVCLICGPLFITPSVLLLLTLVFSYTPRRPLRAFTIGLSALSACILPILQLVGAIPSSYLFTEGMLCILPRAISFEPMPTTVGLMLLNVLLIPAAGVYVGRGRDALRAAEQRIVLNGWLFERLVPDQAIGHEPNTPTTVIPGAPESGAEPKGRRSAGLDAS